MAIYRVDEAICLPDQTAACHYTAVITQEKHLKKKPNVSKDRT